MMIHQTNNFHPSYETLPRVIEFNRKSKITNLEGMIDEVSRHLIKPKMQRPLLEINLFIEEYFAQELVSIYVVVKDPFLALTGELCSSIGLTEFGMSDYEYEYGKFRIYYGPYRGNNIYIMNDKFRWDHGTWKTIYEPIKK